MQGVPLPKTIHWIVFGIHPCEAPVEIGALPQTLQGLSALDLTKGTQSLWNPLISIIIFLQDVKLIFIKEAILNEQR